MLSGGGVKRSRDESNVGGGAPTPLMSSGPLGMGGQMGGGGESGFGPASKRPLFGGGDTRSTYRSDKTPADSLQRYEHSDTLICGNCDSVFRDWLTFREHRKEACDPDSLRKPADEPMVIKCFVCKEEFKHSWTLLQHLSSLHHLTVYIDDSNPDQSNGESTSVKEVTQALKKD